MRLSGYPTHALRLLLAALAAAAALLALPALVGQAGAASSGGVGSYDSSGQEQGGDAGVDSATAGKYERLWDRVSVRDRRWARSTAECESGGNPKAIGGGGQYRGAFQFLKSTWQSSPRSPGGDPINYSYKTQAVVAVALKNRDGAGHWPVCG